MAYRNNKLFLFCGFCIICLINPLFAGIGEDIFKEIKRFSDDGLGISTFQDALKTLKTKEKQIDGETVKRLATDINHKLTTLETSLKELKSNIENEYSNVQSSTSDTNCKDVSSSYSNLVLGDNVDLNKWCITGEVLKGNTVTEFLPTLRIIEKWKAKYDTEKGFKYIKFGDDNGVLYNYPAKRLDQVYDDRFSTWYVETATPSLKDVVLAIDKSRSMGNRDALTIAKQIATTVIKTLNSNDRIAIIAFDENTDTSQNCYERQLAKATDVNKAELTSFVNSIVPVGSTASYSKALIKAFQMFSNTDEVDLKKNPNRKRMIMLITDGDTDEKPADIYNTFKQQATKFSNAVSIPTFGVGTGVSNQGMLKNLSEQTFIAGADVPRATYTHIDSIERTKASYFPQSSVNAITYSVPYKDIFGTGLQISMCMSVTKFKGVFCFDIAIEYLLSEVTYFTDDDGAYAFIVDAQSRVLSHPLLPNIAQLAKESFFVYLQTVEIADDIEFIKSSMASDTPGQKKTEKLRILPRGTGGGQDITTKKEQVTYFWHQVTLPKFAVCIVASKQNRLSIQWSQSLPQVWYHSDYKKPENNDKLCKAFDRTAAKERIAVAITAASYDDPYNFAFFEKPSEEKTTTFLRDSGFSNPGIKNGIRDMSAALFELENIWKKASNTDFIIWRYFATGTGIMVVYPGLQLPRTYDARVRGWFLGAMADKSKYFISTPYVDLWGAGIVITLVKAAAQSTDFTVGVIAMDLTVTSFYFTLTKPISQCTDKSKTCIVIDKAGFIVVHKDWIEQSTPETELEDVHLVKKERNVADILIKHDILQPKRCIDMAKSFKQRDYWEVSDENIRSIDSKFDIIAILGTNLYLIIKSGDSGELPDCDECKSDTCPVQKRCHCPCVRAADSYEYCTATLNTSLSLPCGPKLPPLDFTAMLTAERVKMNDLGLSDCVDYNCVSREQQKCLGVLSCTWCTTKSNKESLGTDCEYCTRVEKCPYGKEKEETKGKCDRGTVDNSQDVWLKEWEFAVIFVFMLILFAAIIAAIVIYFIRKQQILKKPETYNNIQLPRHIVQPDDNNVYIDRRYVNANQNVLREEPVNAQLQLPIPDNNVNDINVNGPAIVNSLPNLNANAARNSNTRPTSEHCYDVLSDVANQPPPQIHQPRKRRDPPPRVPSDTGDTYLQPSASGKDNSGYDPFQGIEDPKDNVHIPKPEIDNQIDDLE